MNCGIRFALSFQQFIYSTLDVWRSSVCFRSLRSLFLTAAAIVSFWARTVLNVFQELAGLIARGQEKQVGKRAVNFPNRIRRYVLSRRNFDEDDTQWLCTTISVFLVIIENSLSGRNKIDRLVESLLWPKRIKMNQWFSEERSLKKEKYQKWC